MVLRLGCAEAGSMQYPFSHRCQIETVDEGTLVAIGDLIEAKGMELSVEAGLQVAVSTVLIQRNSGYSFGCRPFTMTG